MAYNLEAVLTLKDRMTSKMRSATRQMERTNNVAKSLNRDLSRVGDTFSRTSRKVSQNSKMMRNSFKSVGSGIGSLQGQVVGLAAAFGGVMAAKKLFDQTIGSAAQFEHSNILIKAMFQDDAKATKFMKDMTKLAEDSPVLNSQDMFGNAKSFISISKDLNHLNKMYRLVEKLNVMDPQQGVQGAVLGLKEFLGGKDVVSLVERFELSRQELNKIKDLSLDEQIKGLNKMFDKMGVTDKTIQQIGSSTLSLWNQIKEKTDRIFRDMGQPALTKIRDLLDDVNRQMENGDMSGFMKAGQNMITKLTEGAINNGTKLAKAVNGIINDPEFIKQDGLINKGFFVVEKMNEGFQSWVTNGGQAKLDSLAETIISTTSNSLLNNVDKISNAGASLGASLGQAIATGAVNSFRKSFNVKNLLSSAFKNIDGNIFNNGINKGVGKFIVDTITGKDPELEKLTSRPTLPSVSERMQGKFGGVPEIEGSFKSGISYVPKDMTARIHKGERVLTAHENKEYSKGGDKGFTINIANINLRKDSDIDAIAGQLARKIQTAGGLMA